MDTVAKTFVSGLHYVSHCTDPKMGVYTEPKLAHAAVMVGLSCCQVPQNLGEVFDATKKVIAIDVLI